MVVFYTSFIRWLNYFGDFEYKFVGREIKNKYVGSGKVLCSLRKFEENCLPKTYILELDVKRL